MQFHRRPTPILAFLLLLTTATSQAPFRGGAILVGNDARANSGLYLVAGNGTITSVPVSVPLSSLAGVAATRLGEIVLADWSSGNVILVPKTGTARTLANVPGGLRIAEDIDGTFLVTSFRSNSVVRVTRSGAKSTVFALTGGSRPFDVVVDENGDYVFCDDRGIGNTRKGVYRVDRTTKAITPIYTGTGLPLAHGLAFFHNGDLAVMDGVRDEVYRLNRATGQLSVFVSQATLGNNPESIVESGDGGFLMALEHVQNGFEIVRVDATGTVSRIGRNGPFSNLEQVAVIPSLTAPTGLATGPNAIHPFGLDLPAQASTPYLIGFSGSLFPGAALPGDPRGISVNVDGLFTTSILGSAPFIFVSWAGITDPNGTATPRLDLRFFPPGQLAGFTGFAQGFAVNASAPNSIAAITNPLRIDFR